jgi:hypothetical protein
MRRANGWQLDAHLPTLLLYHSDGLQGQHQARYQVSGVRAVAQQQATQVPCHGASPLVPRAEHQDRADVTPVVIK